MDDELHDRALALLHQLTGDAASDFREGQWEAIDALVRARTRVLVVQRTGWGKSAVYFIATKLLRDAGSGPTLLVSPLLALMRNQIEAARRMGVRAETINSANTSDWSAVIDAVQRADVDLLLISPERLANADFRRQVLPAVGAAAGLLVIDEAHCISDWGHDFRPDYRRIRRVLDRLPRTVPVLACTATANNRVVGDIIDQLGPELVLQRGELKRDGLALQVIDLPARAQRLAWLAEVIPTLDGTGIVYCLTKRDTEVVSEWLRSCGITAESYTGDSEGRPELEQRLLDNDLKVVVATSALGMGFDKPDLAFVIHYQSPGSPIAYYQQVGRAGRRLDRSVGVLLRGTEDIEIQDWFIRSAFPTREEAEQIIEVLEDHDGFVKLGALESMVNVRPSRIALLMKNLEVDGAVVAEGQKYQRTAQRWSFDAERLDAIAAQRRIEQDQMRAYGSGTITCRMAYLQGLLDDPTAEPCGVCDLCVGAFLPTIADDDLTRRASRFVRRRPVDITPRKQWPTKRRISDDERIEPGYALCRWGDAGWGDLVRTCRNADHYDDELVDALASLVRDSWNPRPAPTWLTFVPSLRRPGLVADLAARLGASLQLPVQGLVVKNRETVAQREMQNSSQQHDNVRGAFDVSAPLPAGPVLLLDDTVDSQWTITEVGAQLRRAGCPSVLPLALAHAGAA